MFLVVVLPKLPVPRKQAAVPTALQPSPRVPERDEQWQKLGAHGGSGSRQRGAPGTGRCAGRSARPRRARCSAPPPPAPSRRCHTCARRRQTSLTAFRRQAGYGGWNQGAAVRGCLLVCHASPRGGPRGLGKSGGSGRGEQRLRWGPYTSCAPDRWADRLGAFCSSALCELIFACPMQGEQGNRRGPHCCTARQEQERARKSQAVGSAAGEQARGPRAPRTTGARGLPPPRPLGPPTPWRSPPSRASCLHNGTAGGWLCWCMPLQVAHALACWRMRALGVRRQHLGPAAGPRQPLGAGRVGEESAMEKKRFGAWLARSSSELIKTRTGRRLSHKGERGGLVMQERGAAYS